MIAPTVISFWRVLDKYSLFLMLEKFKVGLIVLLARDSGSNYPLLDVTRTSFLLVFIIMGEKNKIKIRKRVV